MISEKVARSMPQSSAVFMCVYVRARACMYLGSGACRVLQNKQLQTSNFFFLSDALSQAAKRSGAQRLKKGVRMQKPRVLNKHLSVCLLLQYLLQSCSRGGGGETMEDRV
jgi:hypothetical protein